MAARRPRRLLKKKKNPREKNGCNCAELGACLWATDTRLTHRETAFTGTGMGRERMCTGSSDGYLLPRWSWGCSGALEVSFWNGDGKVVLDLRLPESLLYIFTLGGLRFLLENCLL